MRIYLLWRRHSLPGLSQVYKRDIERLDDDASQARLRRPRQIQLTTYAYKTDPAEAQRHLGFIIDDTKTPYPINPDGTSVDLYGYLSMAVAAIHVQSREIEALRAEVARLRHRSGDSVVRVPQPWAGLSC